MFEGVIRGGVRNVNAGNALSGTSATTIYTVPTNHSALIPMIWIANADTSAAQYATVTWRDSSASTTFTLIHQKDVAAKDYALITPNLILESGDYIQVTAETADKITVTLTAQEYMDEN